MKLIGNKLNGEYLESILHEPSDDVEEIKIAVAYANGSPKIFDFAIRNNIKLSFFGRYDDSTPIAPPILKSFLDKKNMNFRCYVIQDIFHAKVIWMIGRGAYIGSANLTDRAWNGNIELGVYYSQDELMSHGLSLQLDSFFDRLEGESSPLSEEIYNEVIKNEKRRSELNALTSENRDNFNRKRLLPIKTGLTRVDRKSHEEKSREKFMAEWNSTIQLIRDISNIISNRENTPSWIKHNVPAGVQVDQFLHAYYYNKVRDPENKRKYRYNEFYESNHLDPKQALNSAIDWWKNLQSAPSNENIHIEDYFPLLFELLSKQKIKSCNKEEFIRICNSFHAFRAVARQVKNSKLGISDGDSANMSIRINLLAEKLWNSRTTNGKTVLDVIYYVIWDGNTVDTPLRLWNSIQHDSEYHIEHFGLSCLGELIGWARPNDFPPRNGRTSKALYALGNNVKIHSL